MDINDCYIDVYIYELTVPIKIFLFINLCVKV